MRCFAFAMAATLFIASGCNRTDPGTAETTQRLKVIATVYLDYAVARGEGPANMAELTAHLSRSLAGRIGTLKYAAEDDLFISARDGAPFVLDYGKLICQSDGTAAPIAYERFGKNGTRLAAFANGQVRSLDENLSRNVLGSM